MRTLVIPRRRFTPSCSCYLNRKSLSGFTLVELMVSIVIVTILASLAFMFVKRGVQSAKAAECVSNMRQIHIGVMAVVDSGVRTTHNPRGTFPPYAGMQRRPWNRFVWLDLVAEQMGIAEVEGKDFIWNTHPRETVFRNPLSKYTIGGTETEWDPLTENKDLQKGSYTWNNQLGSWTSQKTLPEEARATRVSLVAYPASTIMFGENDDEKTKGSPIAFWSADTMPQGSYKSGAHCAFVDGHVELIPNNHLNTREWRQHYAGVFLDPKTKRTRKKLSRPD